MSHSIPRALRTSRAQRPCRAVGYLVRRRIVRSGTSNVPRGNLRHQCTPMTCGAAGSPRTSGAAFLRVSGVLRNAVGAHLFSLESNCPFLESPFRSGKIPRSIFERQFHLLAFFPKFRMPSTFSSILLRTTSKASFCDLVAISASSRMSARAFSKPSLARSARFLAASWPA
jgi:hypothetical protein